MRGAGDLEVQSWNARVERYWARAPAWIRLIRRRWRDRVVETVDHAGVILAVRDTGGLTHRYILMTIASAGIAILGLLQSSPAVVIGAMLVSPLMGPIVEFGFSFAVFDQRQLRHSLKTIAVGAVLAVGLSAIIVALSPLAQATTEIMARTRPTLLDLLVAVFSAAAGGYATVRRKSDTLVGVAIATALMPPLAVVGFGLSTRDWPIFLGASWLFMTNLLAIALTIAIVARCYGFGSQNSPRQSLWQLGVLASTFLLLSIPLGITLRDLARDGQRSFAVQAALLDTLGAGARIDSLSVTPGSDGGVRVEGIVFVHKYRPEAGAKLRDEIARRLDAPAEVAVEQVVIAAGAEPVLRASATQRTETLDRQVAQRIASRSGISIADIKVNLDSREVLLRPTGTDRTIAEWRELERDLALAEPGFAVKIIPASGTRLSVRFENGSTEADPAALSLLQWMMTRMDHPPVDLVSYPDFATGSRNANLRIADRRAEEVARFLRASSERNTVLATVIVRDEEELLAGLPRSVEIRVR